MTRSELTRKGLENAKREGVTLGRPAKYKDKSIQEQVIKLRADRKSLKAISRELGISINTVRKTLNHLRSEGNERNR